MTMMDAIPRMVPKTRIIRLINNKSKNLLSVNPNIPFTTISGIFKYVMQKPKGPDAAIKINTVDNVLMLLLQHEIIASKKAHDKQALIQLMHKHMQLQHFLLL